MFHLVPGELTRGGANISAQVEYEILKNPNMVQNISNDLKTRESLAKSITRRKILKKMHR